MPRKGVDSRLRISCTLVARTPLHVGGIGPSVDTDLALAVNGAGGFYVPGTSLTGALRGWLLAGADDQRRKEVKRVWGWQEKNEGHASYVFVEDAPVSPPAGKSIVLSEIREGVGIDRFSGAAANRIKYDRAILPRGTRIHFQMDVELAGSREEQDRARALTHEVLEALAHGRIRLGAGKSRGLGRLAEVKDLRICEQGLKAKAALLKTLDGTGEDKQLGDLKGPASECAGSRLTVEIDWRPRGPLMVKAERDGFAVDMLPLVSAVDDHLTFVLPGSSIKGALRSQAERIVRTLLSDVIEDVRIVEGKQDFIDQIAVNVGRAQNGDTSASLIGWLFGVAGSAGPQKEDGESEGEEKAEGNGDEVPADRSPLPGFSAVTIDDCYSSPETRFSEAAWSAVEQAKDEEELREALNAANLGNAQQAFHVAIDRWLGGAAEGMLYTVLEPHGVNWEPISMTIDLARLPDEQTQRLAVMLCLLTLRDFASGRIPLGFGANRGMGAIEVTGIRVGAADHPTPAWAEQLTQIGFTSGRLSVPDELRHDLNRSWQEWIKQETAEARQ
jgi:CRISPR/Cas system CSM-associated protein Csm3 (group 7 of RAMP superfamily)